MSALPRISGNLDEWKCLIIPDFRCLQCSSLQAPFVISGNKSCFNLQFIRLTLGINFRIRWIMLWKHLCLHLLQEKPGWVGQVQYRDENRQTLVKEHPFYPENGNIGDMRLNCPFSVLSNIQQGTWNHCLYQRPNVYMSVVINIFSYMLQSSNNSI